ncbi:hypothetical protein GF345_03105 [Candidatus Woesearchaeota archaeon]|nr:hypothetical protein [Candidatus Woesearchaeota archaeon]
MEKEMGSGDSKETSVDTSMIRRIKKYIISNRISFEEAKQIFKEDLLAKVFAQKESVPLEVFNHKELGAFESLVKYLHENLYLDFSEISEITARSIKTVWASYKKASEKHSSQFAIHHETIRIPISIIQNRELGVQENIVVYLKDEAGMTYHDIADALERDDRTVWTAYNRAKKKLMKKGQEEA